MKCLLINYLTFLLLIRKLLCIKISINNNDEPLKDKTSLIKCKICSEMFDVNFNYDDFLKGQKSELIKKVFLPLYDNVSEAQSVFTNDNMESISKEISFEYFMKNSDIQDESTALKLKECQNTKQETKECSKLKLDQCEKILAYEDSTCINLQIHMRNIFLSMKKKSINKARVNNYINISQNKVEEIEKPKEFNEISLLDMTPTYIQNNFDSTPKTHWEPMKPVLLANFEKNIGEQLKDISALASEIASLETKLKNLKQTLANKLVTAQSSYNAVQKTLSDISKLVSEPNMSIALKTPSFTEDDWDESAKPKLLNASK